MKTHLAVLMFISILSAQHNDLIRSILTDSAQYKSGCWVTITGTPELQNRTMVLRDSTGIILLDQYDPSALDSIPLTFFGKLDPVYIHGEKTLELEAIVALKENQLIWTEDSTFRNSPTPDSDIHAYLDRIYSRQTTISRFFRGAAFLGTAITLYSFAIIPSAESFAGIQTGFSFGLLGATGTLFGISSYHKTMATRAKISSTRISITPKRCEFYQSKRF